jgi:hypothetical protein
MTAARRLALILLASTGVAALPARADTVTYEDVDGIRYQVTRRTVQVPITQMQDQQQTVYRQQLTTDTIQHQQLYTVPVTQYQLVSRLHGRFNPFITPYWTHHYEPVTTWQQQTATVQIPVTRVGWAPETRTVQAPTTTYRTAEAIVSRIPIGAAPGGSTPERALAAGPSATIAARPGAAGTAGAGVPAVATAPAATYGGTRLTGDPPREATGWQPPSDARYGEAVRR